MPSFAIHLGLWMNIVSSPYWEDHSVDLAHIVCAHSLGLLPSESTSLVRPSTTDGLHIQVEGNKGDRLLTVELRKLPQRPGALRVDYIAIAVTIPSNHADDYSNEITIQRWTRNIQTSVLDVPARILAFNQDQTELNVLFDGGFGDIRGADVKLWEWLKSKLKGQSVQTYRESAVAIPQLRVASIKEMQIVNPKKGEASLYFYRNANERVRLATILKPDGGQKKTFNQKSHDQYLDMLEKNDPHLAKGWIPLLLLEKNNLDATDKDAEPIISQTTAFLPNVAAR
ncbi:MAG: hypothetical protein JWQ35_2545 [Bacteriovoracaceae bacterium]|nr:hypothetical protein [Bacteriovoracaceae bacterium]